MNKKLGILIVLFMLITCVMLVLGESYRSGNRTLCIQAPVIADFENTEAVNQWKIGNTSPNFSINKELIGIQGISGGPSALAVNSNLKKTFLGIKVAFRTKDYNYFEVLPPEYKPELYPDLITLFLNPIPNPYNERFIPLPGNVQSIDVWVAGRNYSYTLEIWLKDFNGFVYALEMGKTDYSGWRNLSRTLPSYIRQEEKYLPKERPLKFIKYVFRADPYERADKFYVYLDHMKVVTDLYIVQYDGIGIEDNW